jgi:hypothetical protein
VHYLTDVNDLWRVQLRSGVVYKLGFEGGESCPEAAVYRGRRFVFGIGCSGVRTFTPGPDGGGRYVIEVEAGAVSGMQGYRLRLGAAGPDDLGVGRPLPNGVVVRGSLSVPALDVTDLWHFDVARTSDVRLDLRSPGLELTLLRDDGGRLGSGTTVRRQLGPGRYVVAVGGGSGGYRLSLLIRDITQTFLRLPPSPVAPGQAVDLRPEVSPASGGSAELQLDRFDPLTGWHFHRLIRVPAGSSVSWVPPAEGRWRVRASFLGTRTASPSRSAYAHLLVEGRL